MTTSATSRLIHAADPQHQGDLGGEGGRHLQCLLSPGRRRPCSRQSNQRNETVRNLDAKPKRSCLSTQHGGAVDGGGEGVWGVWGVQGGGGLGAGGGGQRISKPLRGLVFKNQVSEESYCQIVVTFHFFV